MKKDKGFDAVEMMRSIRSKLLVKYEKDPVSKSKRLSEIRKRYKTRPKRKILANN